MEELPLSLLIRFTLGLHDSTNPMAVDEILTSSVNRAINDHNAALNERHMNNISYHTLRAITTD